MLHPYNQTIKWSKLLGSQLIHKPKPALSHFRYVTRWFCGACLLTVTLGLNAFCVATTALAATVVSPASEPVVAALTVNATSADSATRATGATSADSTAISGNSTGHETTRDNIAHDAHDAHATNAAPARTLVGVELLAHPTGATPHFDLSKHSVVLNNGQVMPLLGLGTWTLSSAEAAECVYAAIKDGYRLFDTAQYYGTQRGVGEGIRRAIAEGLVTRAEVFVTTKLTPYGFSDFDEAIVACNQEIGLDYIDLMLIHQSGSREQELYAAIERAVAKGIVHTLGISNYYDQESISKVIAQATMLPAVIQNENHIFYQNNELKNYLAPYGIVLESYYPLGGRGHTARALNHPTIQAMAQKHQATPAQVMLRWHLQAGFLPIPGSHNLEHIKENYGAFALTLSAEEMEEIAKLNTNERYETW